MGNFTRFGEEKLLDKECFYNAVRDWTTGAKGEKLGGHIRRNLMYNKTWN